MSEQVLLYIDHRKRPVTTTPRFTFPHFPSLAFVPFPSASSFTRVYRYDICSVWWIYIYDYLYIYIYTLQYGFTVYILYWCFLSWSHNLAGRVSFQKDWIVKLRQGTLPKHMISFKFLCLFTSPDLGIVSVDVEFYRWNWSQDVSRFYAMLWYDMIWYKMMEYQIVR